MKKLFYVLMVSAFSAVTFSSCTEEEVKPQTEQENGGAQTNDPFRKG